MTATYRFGEFHYDAAEARLYRGELELDLEPKMHDALRFFLERRGELLSKDELLDKLWPDATVNEDSLTQIVKKLRHALDDDPRDPRFLKTVMKRGYRFLSDPSGPSTPSSEPPGAEELQPPRSAYDPRWYVPRPEERQAQACLAVPGTPLVLLAPERFGKTWTLRHLLQKARAAGSRVVAMNLDLFDAAALGSLDACLREIALQIASAVDRGPELAERCMARSPNPKANLNWMLEREVLPGLAEARSTLVVAIDRADAALDLPLRDELFGLLRAWADNGAGEPSWPALRLALAISTSPALLIRDPSQSPFNISQPIRLADLPDEGLSALASLHGLHAAPDELASLRALVGGHPYLARLAFHAAATRRVTLAALLEDPSATAAAFGDFLDHLRARLERHPELVKVLRAAARGDGVRHPREGERRLLSAGLLTREEPGGDLRLRYRLYERLL